MVDLHSHILPDIDDGSSSSLETFMMLKEAEKAGFTDIFATPHYIQNSLEQNKVDVLEQIREINEGAKNQGINVKIYPGEEIYITPELKKMIEDNKIISINLSKYILMELPMHSNPKFTNEVIFDICNFGYIPIIAHPERYDYLKNNLEIVNEWHNSGALIQCNYGTLIGKYGHTAKKNLIKLLKNRQVDFMGSDCHRAGSVYDDMQTVVKKLKKVVDEDYFELITTTNGKRLTLK